MVKDSFVFRTKYEDALRSLTAEQQGNILMACIAHVSRGETVRLHDPAADMLLSVMLNDIREDLRKYEERCEKNRKSIRKRWGKGVDNNDTNVYERIQTNTNDTNVYDRYLYDSDNEYDNDGDNDVINTICTPPSLSFTTDSERKAEMKKQISDLTKLTLSRLGGGS